MYLNDKSFFVRNIQDAFKFVLKTKIWVFLIKSRKITGLKRVKNNSSFALMFCFLFSFKRWVDEKANILWNSFLLNQVSSADSNEEEEQKNAHAKVRLQYEIDQTSNF